MPKTILSATTDFAARVGGTDYHVRRGDTVHDDHPLALEHPDLFREAGSAVTFPTPPQARPARVESATAAPGEKRNR